VILSRAASSLFWMGRYVARAEFTADLVEATLRLDTLAVRPAGQEAWTSALAVTGMGVTYSGRIEPAEVSRYLLLAPDNPNSSYSCIDSARSNARAVRAALSREASLAINQSWIRLQSRREVCGVEDIPKLVDEIKGSARGFEGATNRLLRNEAQFFLALGAAIERANGTARLLDVKYHLLLPGGERVGGTVDRDQWTGLLRAVSALAAYRWLYREGLKPSLVAELLVLRDEFPRSLMACLEQTVGLLNRISCRIGRESEADRIATRLLEELRNTSGPKLIRGGLHEFIVRFLGDLTKLNGAISAQFGFR
jgi:uncharacterized alpha-E superfamily protein